MTKSVLVTFALFLAVLFAYSNHFHSSFHFDDSHTIQDNPYIREIGHIPRFFADATTFSVLPANRSYRPLVSASLAIDYWLGRGLQPFYFHLSTFLWFLVQLALMYALFLKVSDDRTASLLAVAVYGLHPAVAETVNYVIQRGDVYSTLGVVAGLALYATFPNWRRLGLYLIPVVAAILSKPPAMVFPALLFLYVWMFEGKRPAQALLKCVPAFIVVGASAMLMTAMTPSTYTGGAGSAFGYRMTQPLVALRYVRNFFIPNRLSADTDLSPVRGFFDNGAWLGFVFLAAMIALAVWTSKRTEHRPIAFGLWWFLLALAPTSIFPLAEVENDHRMYFPFVGLALAVAWSLRRVWSKPVAVVCLCLIAAEVFATRQRNEVWKTEESLWYDVTLKSPRNARGLMNYGLTQMEKGDSRKAYDYFERAAVYTPNYYVLEINRGIANGELNQDVEAEKHFRRSIELAPAQADTHFYYARWLHRKGRWTDAVDHLQIAVRNNPGLVQARHLLMEVLAQETDWPQLKIAATQTLDRFPSDEISKGYFARAGSAPMTPEAHLNLSLAHHRAGKFRECIAAAEEALKLRPDYAEAYNNIAAGYQSLKMWDEAIAASKKALKIKPDYELARNNLLWSEQQKKAAGKAGR